MSDLVPVEIIASKIFLIRGQKVMIDRDSAGLYGVPTKRLNEQVKRNIRRFPEDFMFHLTKEEKNELVANCDRFKTLKHSTVRRNLTHSAVISTPSTLVRQKRIKDVPIFFPRRESLGGQTECLI